ncbi:hypothetical protein SLS56_004619 [Neofusicoccum ribis]|uniref:Alcohol dehydrogenase n=1 Tax=Neofusicoccum ribis TaxID=45134 RepID=A0ABR3SWZ2_9PEZI
MSAPVPKTMRAARLTEFNKPYELLEIPVPTIGPNDLLIKIGAAGFCHTDHQVYEGVYKSQLPITPSHEPVGTVVAPNRAGIAAAQLRPGVPVAVVGVGGLGQLAVQFLKALGHPTVAIDNRVEGLELASEAGPEALRADAVVDFKADDAAEQVAQFAGEGGAVAAVIVCTESVEATEWSLKLLQPHGVVVPLGLPVEGFHFNAFDIVFKELIVRGSLVATKGQVDEMLAVVDKHGIRSHVTTVGFEDVPRLPELYMDKHLKGRLVLKM